MGKVQVVKHINASPERVFTYVDDIRNVARHATSGMGARLKLEITSPNDRGLGATYHWSGKVFGIKIDFTEVVTKWVENREKAYQSISGGKLSLHYTLSPVPGGTQVACTLEYELPIPIIGGLIDYLIINRLAKNSLDKMYQHMKKAIEIN